MRFTAIFGLAALGVTASANPVPISKPDIFSVPEASNSTSSTTTGQQVLDLGGTLRLDSEGITHIGDDGVFRSYAGNGTVIDALPLTNEQLTVLTNDLPPPFQDFSAHLQDLYANVSGHDVNASDHFDPPDYLRLPNWPPPPEIGPRTNPGWDLPPVVPVPEPPGPCWEYRCYTNKFCRSKQCLYCVALDMSSISLRTPGICKDSIFK